MPTAEQRQPGRGIETLEACDHLRQRLRFGPLRFLSMSSLTRA